MEIPGLGNQTDRIDRRLQQRLQAGIVGDRPARALGHAERREACVLEIRFLGEERGVRVVGAGIAALDVVDAQFVEHLGNAALVLDGEINAVRLRAITQGRVEEIEAFAGNGHWALTRH